MSGPASETPCGDRHAFNPVVTVSCTLPADGHQWHRSAYLPMPYEWNAEGGRVPEAETAGGGCGEANPHTGTPCYREAGHEGPHNSGVVIWTTLPGERRSTPDPSDDTAGECRCPHDQRLHGPSGCAACGCPEAVADICPCSEPKWTHRTVLHASVTSDDTVTVDAHDHDPCCNACGGSGVDPSENITCGDCYGTGHPHPSDDTGTVDFAAADAWWLGSLDQKQRDYLAQRDAALVADRDRLIEHYASEATANLYRAKEAENAVAAAEKRGAQAVVQRVEAFIGASSFGVAVPGARERDPSHNGAHDVVRVDELRAALVPSDEGVES